MPDVMISWRTSDGEERDERWPSVERFRLWALGQGLRCTWTAYCQPPGSGDEDDDEWVVVDFGQVET